MMGLPDEFPDENGERHIFNQIPLTFHPQPESLEGGNVPAGGHPLAQSFNFARDYDLNFPFHVSGTQSFEMGHHFMHPGTSGIYVNHAAGRIANTSELLSLPSGVTPGHAFPSHLSSIYESNLTTGSPHHSRGLPQLQSVNYALNYALPVHSPNSILHAPSPCNSDSSFDETGSGYSSPSMTPHRNSTMTLPSHSETEEYLRKALDIPPHLPVNLSALPDASDKKHPPITHMIKLAIWGSQNKMLTLRGIYNAIEERYPSLKDLQDKPWQRSIRHNLSLKAIFVRVERPPNVPGSGHYWAIDIRNGEGNKRDRKRKDPSSRGSSSRSRSDEEDDFSEDVDEERSVSRRRHGEQGAIRIPSQIPIQYTANPPMFSSGSLQTESRITYPLATQPQRMGQQFLHPQPAQTAANTGRLNEFYPYPRGMSLPPNIEHRPFYRTTYGPFLDLPDQNTFVQEQMSMANMASDMAHQMPALGPYPYGQASGSRRPTPDEGQDDNTKTTSRNID